ncbi:dbo [Symbiodinium natans]|uniref:Dbo protein n=1 Tax=Symbiodinium natans TaxID=878477 RepID=A0A812V9S2_9DINO|nr:dbo [Symbiodinium natans]
MASSQSHDADVIAGFINLGDVSGLKRFAGRDFDWNACLTFGGARMLPLAAAISANIADPSYSGNAIQVIQWMIEAGASPRHRAPHTVKDSWSMWKEDDTEKTKMSVNLAGHSAISYAFKWLDEMRKRKGGADWSSSIKFLEVVVRTLASEPSTTPKVGVHHSVCELWESIRELTSTHNVILETSDGEVSAHDHVLMVASPVLKAMLGSSMQEGASRRIPIRDSPSASVSLFLDILYAGSTYSHLLLQKVER